MALRVIFLVALSVLLLAGITRANDAPSLTGSEMKTEDAVLASDAIFTGEIEHIEGPVLAALGEKAYYGIGVKVISVLKGSAGTETTVALVARMDTKIRETAPEAKKAYIFFAKKKNIGSQFRVIKLLLLDEAIVTHVKQMIFLLPKSQENSN